MMFFVTGSKQIILFDDPLSPDVLRCCHTTAQWVFELQERVHVSIISINVYTVKILHQAQMRIPGVSYHIQ